MYCADDGTSRESLAVDLDGVTKTFDLPDGGTYTAIKDLDLSVRPGEFCAVVGPTGCGKSTSLGLVAGLDRPTRGEVRVAGEQVTDVNLDVGILFQTDAVLPWKKVLANVACGPLFRRMNKRDAYALSKDWLARVGLAGFEDRYIHQLSGGMRRRVAFAQSMINEPRVLLMDEPFSALDVQTRLIMSDELLNLWELTKPTVIFVTHDLEEAITLADRVVVMTAVPGTVKSTFEIDLPRPRAVEELRFSAAFREFYEEIWGCLRDEVLEAYARSTQGRVPVGANSSVSAGQP